MVLGIITTAYLARTLGKSSFGIYSYAQTLAIYSASIIDFGWNSYGNRAVARDPSRAGQYLLNISFFQVISGTAFILLLIAVTSFVDIWDKELKSVVLVSILWIFPFALNIEWLYQGYQRMGTVALGRFIQQLSILVFTLLFVKSSLNLFLAPLLRTIGGMVSAVWLLFKLPKGIFHGTFIGLHQITRYFRDSKWFWLSAFLVQVYHGSDVIILKIFWPASEIGEYSAAFRLLSLGIALISLVNVAVFPLFSAEHSRGEGKFKELMKFHLLISCIIAFFLIIVLIPLASIIVSVVYGGQYVNATSVFIVLVVASAVVTINGALSQPLLAAGEERIVFLVVFVTAIFNIVFNIIFIPKYGGKGAAWVYLASVFLSTILLLPVYIRRLVKVM